MSNYYIYKVLFFQFFNSPVALKNIKKLASQEKVEMTPLVCVLDLQPSTTGKALWNFEFYKNLSIKFKQVSKTVVFFAGITFLFPGTTLLCWTLLRTTWFMPEQSHLLHESCSLNGTDKKTTVRRLRLNPASFQNTAIVYYSGIL